LLEFPDGALCGGQITGTVRLVVAVAAEERGADTSADDGDQNSGGERPFEGTPRAF